MNYKVLCEYMGPLITVLISQIQWFLAHDVLKLKDKIEIIR